MSFLFFKQKTAYEVRISDWSSDVCSSDLAAVADIHEATGMPLELARSGTLMLIAGSPQKILSVSRKFTPSDSGVGTCGGNLYYDLGKIGRASCRERVCRYV